MKKLKMIESDEMYVLNQPRHTMVSLILMNSEYPLGIEGNVIFKLSEISDLIFIFSPLHFPSEEKIDRTKFTTLHQGCAFIKSGGELCKTVFKVLQYCQEVFNKHVGYTISLSSEIKFLGKDDIDKLVKINMSSLNKPIFESTRLSENELYEFYRIPEIPKTSTIFSSLFGFSRESENSIVSYILWNEYLPEGNDCRYCTWGSSSSIMFFKNGVIKIFLDNQENLKDILKTFTDPDIRYIFTNLVKILGIDTIDSNFQDLDVNKLN